MLIDKLQDVVGREVVDYSTDQLIASGENYGSVILKVDIRVKNDGKIETINCVAKLVPLDEETQELFSTEMTFRVEIAFYKNIVPTLQGFQKKNGIENVINFFPKYYGSRLNLNCDDSKVDSNGIILLENLKLHNYVNVERTEGFNLEVTQLLVKNLAEFHALPIALREKDEDLFKNGILKKLCDSRFHEGVHKLTKFHLGKVIDSIPEIQSFKDQALECFDLKKTPLRKNLLFDTIIHNDYWVNNIMVKFQNSKPVDAKMVDFQDVLYGSAMRDVVFLLFSSVQTQILEKHYEDLIKLYFDVFIATLKSLNCEIENYTFGKFQEEIEYTAKYSQFGHLMFMLYPIFGERGRALGLVELLESGPSELQKKKLVFIIKEFSKRNWI